MSDEEGVWDLAELFRGVRARVLDNERLFALAELPTTLSRDTPLPFEAELQAAYERLSAYQRPAYPEKRSQTVYALLEQLRRETFAIQRWCRADVVQITTPNGRERLVVTLVVDGTAFELRQDQIIAAAFWGVGVDAVDPKHTSRLRQWVARAAIKKLCSDLVAIEKILRSYNPIRVPRLPSIVPTPDDRRFEQLMLDILNEHERVARRASVIEDFCEKTDLRVKYPGLKRKLGARVQVASSANPEFHDQKIEAIRRADELVVLSPLSLSRFLKRETAAEDPKRRERAMEVLALLPDPSATVVGVARLLRARLTTSLENVTDPRGPRAALPECIRHVIRDFVQQEAFRTTNVLREHEATDEARPRRSGKRRTWEPVKGRARPASKDGT